MMMDKLGDEGGIENYRANIFIFSKINFLTCDYIGYGYPFKGNIVFNGMEGIQLISSQDCSILKTYITREEMENLSEYFSVGTNYLSRNEDFLLMSLDQDLVKITFPEKEIYYYHKTGCCSALSPDQKKIVYIASNGFHIMGIDGEEDKLIVTNSRGSLSSIKPNWSSDSNKITYHKCIPRGGRNPCHEIDDYSIYIYDVVTGIETRLLNGGTYPSWRPEE